MQTRQQAVRAGRRTRAGAILGAIGAIGLGLAGTAATTVATSVATATAAGAVTYATPTVSCGETPYVVPAGVTKVAVVLVGQAGSSGQNSIRGWGGAPGGEGSKVTATMDVTPGQSLYVGVAAGTALPGGYGGRSWANGQVGYGGKGGNASYIATAEPATSNCIIDRASLAFVAAGGGGGGGGGAGISTSHYPILMHGGDGGTEFVHGDGYPGAGNDEHDDHDGKGGLAATAIAHGDGGAPGAGGSSYVLNPTDPGYGIGIGGCITGQHGAAGTDQNGGFGGVAPVPGNFLDDKCLGFKDDKRAGGGGGGGGGYYSGGGGGGGDSANGSGGGGGAGNSYIRGAGSIGPTVEDPSVTITPLATPPTFTSAATTAFPVGAITHFQPSAIGYPAVQFAPVHGVPSWLNVADTGNGTADVWGTPPPGTTGTVTVPLTIFNSSGSTATQNLVLSITGPPTITSANRATFLAGSPNTFTVTTSGTPKPAITQNQTLPAWLTLTDNHDGTATLTGTPPTTGFAGTVATTLTATSTNPPAASQAFTLEVLSSIAVTAAVPPMHTTETRQLAAIGTHPDGSTVNVTAQANWASTSPAVATVTGSGLVTALTTGSTNVTATLGAVTGSVALAVKNPVSLAITPANATVGQNATQQFTATATYADATTADLTGTSRWHVLGGGIVNISATGLATASNTPGSYGTVDATIDTSPSAYVSASTNLNVGIGTLTSIVVTPPTASVSLSAASPTVAFRATGHYASGTISDLSGTTSWVSSNPAVASISPSGRATALSSGTTTISSTTAGVTGTATLTVKLGDPVSIAITPGSPTLSPGALVQLTARATYGDASTGDVTNQVSWLSTNTAVATVSASGQLQMIGTTHGTPVTISARFTGTGTVAGNTVATVTLDHPTAITVTPANAVVMSGASLTYTAIGSFLNGSLADISLRATWGSSDTAIASSGSRSVSTSPASTGTTTISATSIDGLTVGSTPLTSKHVALSGPTTATVTPTAAFTSAAFVASDGPGTYTWTASNLPLGVSLSATTGSSVTLTGTVPAEAGYHAGDVRTVTVTASSSPGAPASTAVTFALTFAKTPQTITFDAPFHGTPGTTATLQATSTASSSNRLTMTVAPSSTPGTCSVSSPVLTSGSSPTWIFAVTVTYAASGTCAIDVAQGADGDHLAATTVHATIPVDKGTLTIRANDASVTYGDTTVPTFGATVTGFAGTDTLASLGGALVCSPGFTPSATTHAAHYAITCSGATTIDYALTYESGTLAVDPAPLAVEPNAATIHVGDPVPAFDPDYIGFVNGETAAVLDQAPTCPPATSVSTAAGIFPVTCGGGADVDYTLAYGATLLTIDPAIVTATFHGTQPFGRTSTFTLTPDTTLPGGVTLTGTLTCTGLIGGAPIDTSVAVGNYAVDPATCSGAGLSDPTDYVLVLSHGTIDVSQSFPTLSWPKPANITYGTPLGAGQLGAVATGVDGQPLPGTFVYSIPAGSVLPAVTGVNITAYFTPDDTADYAATATSVTLDIDKAVLVTTPHDTAIVLGQPISITKSLTGFVNGEGPGALSGQPFCTASGVTGVGSFPITCAGGAAANYTFDNTATATLTIGPARSGISVVQGPPAGPVTVGAPASFTATVSVLAPGSGGATGSVFFTDNGAPVPCQAGSGALVGPFASCSIVFATAGPHLVAASYSGDANVSGSSTPSPLVVNVDPVPPTSGITGTVTDTTGAGLDKITVTAVDWWYGTTIASTTTAKGAYSLSIPVTRRKIKVRFSDATGRHLPRFDGNQPTLALAPIVALPTTTPVDVVLLDAPAVLNGTVTDTGGTPLAGIAVEVSNAYYGNIVATTTTDGSGRYAVLGSIPATNYQVRFSETGPGATHTPISLAATVTTGSTTTLDAVLTVGHALRGVVRSAAGPEANIYVVAVTATAPVTVAAIVTTGPDGSYAVGPLAPGAYKLAFVDPRNLAKIRYGLAPVIFGDHDILTEGLDAAYFAGSSVTIGTSDVVLPDVVLAPLVAVTPGTLLTAAFGSPVSITATFRGVAMTATATVTVDGVDHTVAVVDRQVAYATDPTLAVGKHAITVTYDGDPQNLAQRSDTIVLVVT